MEGKFVVLVWIIIPFFTRSIHGYSVTGYEDTSDGYCDLDDYGRIPTGQTFFHFEICERAACRTNEYIIEGCESINYNSEFCWLRNMTGLYPACCPQVQCQEWIEGSSNHLCRLC